MQAFQTYRRLPDPVGCTQVECLAYGPVGKGLVAPGGQPFGDARHEQPVVRGTRTGQRVNREKSAVAYIEERTFLGHRLLGGGKLGIAPKSLERAKDRIRQITRRNRGIRLDRMIRELNSFLTGWVTYFRYAACKTYLAELDGWVRRKLRCVRLILQEPRHRRQHPLPRRLGLHIDVAVVGIAAEAVATPFQFLVQIVQQLIRQDR
jgi:hypothetical protein